MVWTKNRHGPLA